VVALSVVIRLSVQWLALPLPKASHCTFASSTSQKFSKKSLLFYIGGGEKFIKGVFARFRPLQPPKDILRRSSGGWKAESFLVAWRGWLYPTHPKQSLCSGLIRLRRIRLPALKTCFFP